MTPAIETIALGKSYRNGRMQELRALDDVSLRVEQGEIFALLGLNGAGKSTLIKTLLGLVRPSSGTATLLGAPLGSEESKACVGYLPELFRTPKDMGGEDLLRYLGALSGLKGRVLETRITQTLGAVGLSTVGSQKSSTYSKGMMLRLGIAQALLHSPRLVFLDEPTEGLDPLGRRAIRDLLISLRSNGTCVFLNSHLLSEIELVADRVAILHHGKVVTQGRLTELLPSDDFFEIDVAVNPQDGNPWTFTPDRLVWTHTIQGHLHLNALLLSLGSRSIPVLAVRPARTTLEDVFFSYVGESVPS